MDLTLMDRLYNKDHSHPNPTEMEERVPAKTSYLGERKIGMMINGDWTIQILQNLEASRTENCRWDAAPLPLTNGAEAGTSIGSNSYLAVYSQSRYPENAFEFLEFCCGGGRRLHSCGPLLLPLLLHGERQRKLYAECRFCTDRIFLLMPFCRMKKASTCFTRI